MATEFREAERDRRKRGLRTRHGGEEQVESVGAAYHNPPPAPPYNVGRQTP